MTTQMDDAAAQRSRLEVSLAPVRKAQHLPGYIYVLFGVEY